MVRHNRPIRDIPKLVDFLTDVQLRLDDQQQSDDAIAAAMAEAIVNMRIAS